jgi:CRP/FNR family transcriptional regulator, cyclic AMP receptor protein
MVRARRTTPPRLGRRLASRRVGTMDTKTAALLRFLPGCGERGARELWRLAWQFDEVRVDAGTTLAYQGQPGLELCLIVDGEATVSVGRELVSVLGPGDVVGEATILGNGPHRCTVTARTPMRLLVAGSHCRHLLRRDPVVLRQIATNLADRLYRAENSIHQPGSAAPPSHVARCRDDRDGDRSLRLASRRDA